MLTILRTSRFHQYENAVFLLWNVKPQLMISTHVIAQTKNEISDGGEAGNETGTYHGFESLRRRFFFALRDTCHGFEPHITVKNIAQ